MREVREVREVCERVCVYREVRREFAGRERETGGRGAVFFLEPSFDRTAFEAAATQHASRITAAHADTVRHTVSNRSGIAERSDACG